MEELKIFVGVIRYKGIFNLRELKDYWDKMGLRQENKWLFQIQDKIKMEYKWFEKSRS